MNADALTKRYLAEIEQAVEELEELDPEDAQRVVDHVCSTLEAEIALDNARATALAFEQAMRGHLLH